MDYKVFSKLYNTTSNKERWKVLMQLKVALAFDKRLLKEGRPDENRLEKIFEQLPSILNTDADIEHIIEIHFSQ